MANPEGRLFYLPTEQVKDGEIQVHILPDEMKENDTFRVSSGSMIIGGEDLASSFLSGGMVNKLLKEGKTIGIIVNPKDLERYEKEHPCR